MRYYVVGLNEKAVEICDKVFNMHGEVKFEWAFPVKRAKDRFVSILTKAGASESDMIVKEVLL